MDKDLRKLLKELEAQGFEVRISRNGHPQVYRDGVWVATFSGTPSDRRGFRNSLAACKRAGFRPKGR